MEPAFNIILKITTARTGAPGGVMVINLISTEIIVTEIIITKG